MKTSGGVDRRQILTQARLPKDRRDVSTDGLRAVLVVAVSASATPPDPETVIWAVLAR
jgi:hypothetical protein